MNRPILSEHLKNRKPSPIRLGQIEFAKRKDSTEAVNVAIGNVSLPMHPAMQKRMFSLDSETSPFRNGVVKYTAAVGEIETRNAFLNIIKSSGFDTSKLNSMVTDGGSQAMELVVVGVCGPAGTSESPLLLIDPAYTNYISFAERTGRKVVSVRRSLQSDGKFTLPDMDEIEKTIQKHKPGAIIIIPFDNPTGQFYGRDSMISLGRLCVKYNMWMVSDESYRELFYCKGDISSVWALNDSIVPGIEGRRISLETASKVWNACGLRIGGIVTDNQEFHEKAVAEYTANLCANAIGQYIFGALAHESTQDLNKWYDTQRLYYKPLMEQIKAGLEKKLPGIIVSRPDAAIYSVIDVRNIARPGFKSIDFVLFCCREGKVIVDGKAYTLLTAPMSGFYNLNKGEADPGDMQMRVAFVEKPDSMTLLPDLFAELLKQYEKSKGN